MTTAPDQISERLAQLAATLRERGAITTDQVHKAFATVERHKCLTSFHYRADRFEMPQDIAPPTEVLDLVYSPASLLTVMPAPGEPASSTSEPGLMARMLEALDLAPGMRVLEIGAGTGYNAALITAITGAEVVTVEAGDEAAAGAAASIDRLGLLDRVRVLHQDGYLGAPDAGTFDRIIVTVGIAGIPPGWFDQLTEEGKILAPLAHGGVHPTMAIHSDRSVSAVLWSDFMTAVGPLRPAEVIGRRPGTTITGDPKELPAVVGELDATAYNDLWFYLAARDTRTTRAALDSPEFDPGAGMCALVADDQRAAWIRRDGSLLRTDTVLGAELARLVGAWESVGYPGLGQWSGTLTPAETNRPLLVPSGWSY